MKTVIYRESLYEFPHEIRSAFQEQLPPAAHRLLEIILKTAIKVEGQPDRYSAPKRDVLSALESAEGAPVDNDALRQRIQTIRKLMTSHAQLIVDGTPLLSIRSTKGAIEIAWSKAAKAQLAIARTKSILIKSGQDDYAINIGDKEPIRATLAVPLHKVLISHNWENEAVNKVLDDFVEQLQAKLRKLPASYHGRFAIDLLYDRKGDMHGRAEFRDQMDRLCAESAMAIFMTSNGWCTSGPCQHEAQHFRARCQDGREKPFIQIQLCDARSELAAPYVGFPTYPEIAPGFDKVRNLLALMDKPLAERDEFIGQIRDQICAFLDGLPSMPEDSASRSVLHGEPKDKRQILMARFNTPDLDAGRHVRAEFTPENGDDDEQTAEGRLFAVDTLYDWACDKTAKSRMVVLLGGFGMGKTTTVQALHERLSNEVADGRDAPTPIYLDFRRLIPMTEPGKEIKASLAELVVSALHADARNSISGEEVIELIRTNNCLVIFDGLDEIGNRIGRDYAAQLFRQFLEFIPSELQAKEARSGQADWAACPARLILTCRTHFFRSLREQRSLLGGSHRRAVNLGNPGEGMKLPGIDTYYMAPLSLDQIRELFELHLGEEMGAKTFALIQGIHDLPGLASRPIMARFISEIAGHLVELNRMGTPINIATIYEELFLQTLERDAEKRPLLSPADRQDMLRALAAHMQISGQSRLSANFLEKWFDSFAKGHDGILLTLQSNAVNARGLLHTEIENSSLLVRGQDDCFGFAHTSYFEYFLACALYAAETDVSLEPLCARALSSETLSFIEAIAVKERGEAALVARWCHILCGQGHGRVRRLAFDMLARSGRSPYITGANLSGFDLRETALERGAMIEGVDFSNAALNGLDARDVTFRTCNFEGAELGNAKLENCRFEALSGLPFGLVSARGINTSLPAAWQADAPLDPARWQQAESYVGRAIILASPINGVAFSPDGAWLATGSDDGTARLWDVQRGTERLTLEGHGDWIRSVAFSPDGAWLATGSGDGTVRLWDVQRGTERLTLEGHGDGVSSVAFSPDGAWLATGSNGGTVRLWDVQRGTERLTLEGHGDGVRSVAFSPDGAWLATGSYDGTVRLWDAQRGTERLTLEGHGGGVRSVAFSPDGAWLATGSNDGTVRLWDAQRGSERLTLKGHGGGVSSVAFSPDGAWLATGSDDGTVRLWDVQRGTERLTLGGHGGGVSSVAFSPDGAWLATGSYDGTARLWDAQRGTERLTLGGHGRWVNSVAFSPDGAWLATGSNGGTVRLWDAQRGSERLTLEGHGGGVSSVAFSPDGAWLATGSYDGTVRLWDVQRGTERLTLEGHGDGVSSVAFSPDGAWLATGSDDGTVRLWDVQRGSGRLTLEGHGGGVSSVAFSPDGAWLATGSFGGTVQLWDVQRGTERLTLEGHGGGASSVAFSPDGAWLATGSFGGTVQLWDVQRGSGRLTLEGHGDWVNSVAFSPDGAWLATGSDDGTARLWDVQRGTERLTLEGHGDWIRSVAFSPDGAWLATGSDDGTARLWDAQRGAVQHALLPLPESWARLDGRGAVEGHGPHFWRYVA